jgi:hypothetical protein
MTDFTDTIESTAASVEDLSEDLEAHLTDILGVDATVTEVDIRTGADDPYLTAEVELSELEDRLEDRLDGVASVWGFRVDLREEADPE